MSSSLLVFPLASPEPADYALLYVASHPYEHLEKGKEVNHPLLKLAGPDHGVVDQNAILTVDDKHVVTVKTTGPNPSIVFTSTDYKPWATHLPDPVGPTEGKLYVRGSLPDMGVDGFFIQEFPPYPNSAEPGRINIEFWNDNRITAVFKTKYGNEFGAQGDGKWA